MEQQNHPTNIYLQASLYAVLFICAMCSVLYYFIYIRTVHRWKKSNIPFLHPMFLFGHKYIFNGGKILNATVTLNKVYTDSENKDIVAFFLMTTPIILIKNTKLIQQIFTKNFDKTYESGFRLLKNDIESQSFLPGTSNKKEWKTGRTIMAPAFATSRLYGATNFAKIKKQVDRLMEFTKKAELQGQLLNVDKATCNFFFDSIALLSFDVDTNSFEKKEEINELVKSIIAPSYTAMIKFFILIHLPFLQIFGVLRFINPKTSNFIKNLLVEQMTQRVGHIFTHNDLVDLFISLEQKEFPGSDEEKSRNSMQEKEGKWRLSFVDLSDYQYTCKHLYLTSCASQKILPETVFFRRLIGYSLSVLVAGQTPGVSAAYTLHLLSLQPEYQEKIREEIKEAMRKYQVTELTPEVIKDLQITKQCILEAERLYPTFAFIPRRCTDDIQIPGASFSLKKGDIVAVSPYAIHRDPKYFKDPDKFDPERFSPQNKGSFPAEAFLAFGIGPKKCPAYEQGNFLAVTCVAALLYMYEIWPHSHLKQMDAMDYDPKSNLNHHKGDLLVKLVPRRDVTGQNRQ